MRGPLDDFGDACLANGQLSELLASDPLGLHRWRWVWVASAARRLIPAIVAA